MQHCPKIGLPQSVLLDTFVKVFLELHRNKAALTLLYKLILRDINCTLLITQLNFLLQD